MVLQYIMLWHGVTAYNTKELIMTKKEQRDAAFQAAKTHEEKVALILDSLFNDDDNDEVVESDDAFIRRVFASVE